MNEIIAEYCKTNDSSILENLDAEAKQLFISSCVRELFQPTGDTKLAMAVLTHFKLVESFYKAEGKNIIHYTGSVKPGGTLDSLLYIGAATVPVYTSDELEQLSKDFTATCESFPEYLPNVDIYVLGGFAAFGNPASFHNPFVRNLRGKANSAVKKALFEPFLRSYPDPTFAKTVHSEVLFDRMMQRPIMQTPTAEAWHRDIIDKKHADVHPGDIIFGGWTNTSKFAQSFSFIPGSHLGVDLYSLKSGGFAEPGAIFDSRIGKVQKKIKVMKGAMNGKSKKEIEEATETLRDELKSFRKDRKALYELFKQHKTSITIPPGHAVIFPQYVLHEVVNKGQKHVIERVFTGYRLTQSTTPMMVDATTKKSTLLENTTNQSIMRLGGGMLPPMYSANHQMSFLRKKFMIYGSKNPSHGKGSDDPVKEDLISWSDKSFKAACLIDRPARAGHPEYKVVKRYMNSLKEMNLPLYPAYTKEELTIYYPQKVLVAKKKKKMRMVKKVRTVKRVKKVKKKATTVIVSWNVNSIRARIVDNMLGSCKLKTRPIKPDSALGELISKEHPDIICFQETKCTGATRQCITPEGFFHYWNCCTRKKGYSGVSIWSRTEPEKIVRDLPGLNKRSAHLLQEGRILTAYYPTFILVTTYTPNTLRAGAYRKSTGTFQHPEFIQSRGDWDAAMLKYLKQLETEKPVVWCGDFNVARGLQDFYKGTMTKDKLKAHGTIDEHDVFTPKPDLSNSTRAAAHNMYERYMSAVEMEKDGGGAGFRIGERKDIEKIITAGFVDTFREKYPDKYGFTYWDMTRPAFRGANNGMRLDYFFVSKKLLSRVSNVKVLPTLGIHPQTKKVASDHAPVVLTLKNKK
jgi:exodeoxyribonuclease-3